ncbi:hypothetical protein EVAR_86129_1 [Eumeta japonica]|uniref:Uncharacterized protein n=1 Tax=Eumeta variegata TaxID=151549 RepID=A0A4C1V1U9_EUMVA|nr:hypothetical protein EVAR_86129_1 [Eumeta japonica]
MTHVLLDHPFLQIITFRNFLVNSVIWINIVSKTTLERLLREVPDAINKARLRSAFASESGAWLYMLPLLNFSTLLDYNSLRVVVAIWLSSNGCEPLLHNCGSQTFVTQRSALCSLWLADLST